MYNNNNILRVIKRNIEKKLKRRFVCPLIGIEFIKQKQQGDLQRAVPQLVEMQHHQHTQGTIGQGEGPIVGRHQQVLAQLRRQLRKRSMDQP